MSVSLHTAVVGTFRQILPSLAGLVDKAEVHCRDNGMQPEALCDARLADDMWCFAKQVTTVAHHSGGAIEGVRNGVIGPDLSPAPTDFAALRRAVADAMAIVDAVAPDELDAIAGRDMRFEFRDRRMDFTVSDFLLSFTLPNFYFHATAAYAILRHQGLAVGKMDFLGRPRLKS